jgi:WD40 repeat protein
MKYGILIGLLGAAVLLVGCAAQEDGPPKQPAAAPPPGPEVTIDGGPPLPELPEEDWYGGFVAGDRLLMTDTGASISQLDAITGRGLRTITPQVSHPGSVLFLPDGQHAVTVGPQVVCWDLDTGKERWSFADQPLAKKNFCGAISPDGCWGVHVNQDGSLRLWDAARGQVRTLGRHAAFVRWLTFSADSQWLLSGDGDGVIKLWNVRQGVFCRTVDGDGRVTGALSPDGKYGLTRLGEAHTAALWEVASGKEIRRLKLAPVAIGQLVFLPDGKRVLAVGDDRKVRTWDVNTGKLVRECYWKEGLGADSVVVSPEGKRALLIGTGTVALWDLENNEEVRTLGNRFAAHTQGVAGVTHVTFSPDGRQVLGLAFGKNGPAFSWDALSAWDAESGRYFRTVKVDHGTCLIVWSADRTQALTAVPPNNANGFAAELSLWDVARGRRIRTLESVHGHVDCLDLSQDGRFALGSYVNHTLPKERALLLWDLESGRLIQRIGRELSEEQFQCVHFTPDGRRILVGTSRWQVWDVATEKLLHDWPGPENPFKAIQSYRAVFSRDAIRALTYGEKLQLWDLTNGTLVQTWSVPPDRFFGYYTAAAFSPDGKWVLSAGGPEGDIQLWEVARGQPLRTFVGRGMPGRIDSLAFSPDGKRAVAGGEYMAQIWDVKRGQDIHSLVLKKVP